MEVFLLVLLVVLLSLIPPALMYTYPWKHTRKKVVAWNGQGAPGGLQHPVLVMYFAVPRETYTFSARRGLTVNEIRNYISEHFVPIKDAAQVTWGVMGDQVDGNLKVRGDGSRALVFSEYLCPGCNQVLGSHKQKHRCLPPPPPHLGTKMGYVYGFRVMKFVLIPAPLRADWLEEDQPLPELSYEQCFGLAGLYGKVWKEPYLHADCESDLFEPDEQVPHPNPCKCGVNMYHNLDRISSSQPTELIALTRGWGRVIEHEDGYRVEHAEILGFLGQPLNDIGLWHEKHSTFSEVPLFFSTEEFQQFAKEQVSLLITIPDSEA